MMTTMYKEEMLKSAIILLSFLEKKITLNQYKVSTILNRLLYISVKKPIVIGSNLEDVQKFLKYNGITCLWK